jgi:hypothetical protein
MLKDRVKKRINLQIFVIYPKCDHLKGILWGRFQRCPHLLDLVFRDWLEPFPPSLESREWKYVGPVSQ